MVTQEVSIAETIKKFGLEELLSIGEVIDKYYGDLIEAKKLPRYYQNIGHTTVR